LASARPLSTARMPRSTSAAGSSLASVVATTWGAASAQLSTDGTQQGAEKVRQLVATGGSQSPRHDYANLPIRIAYPACGCSHMQDYGARQGEKGPLTTISEKGRRRW